jgi:hypothetical protein
MGLRKKRSADPEKIYSLSIAATWAPGRWAAMDKL